MKVNISKNKLRGGIKWTLTVHHNGQRRRKYFDSMVEANMFDVVSWLGEVKEKEVMGDQTLLHIARDKYLAEYHENNFNPAKPKQKGFKTTEERVNRFLSWFGEGRAVSDVTVEEYKNYVNAGKLSPTTRQEYGRAVRIFMAWCSKQGFGGNAADWYMQTNPDLKMSKKKTYFKLPGILEVEQAIALLNELDPKYKPSMAIMLFTGIRPELEMATLKYSMIQHGQRIGLPAELTKTGRERWIEPPENLWAWVPKSKGLVMPSYNALNLARRWASRKVGFKYPANGARHSFASYGYWKDFTWALDTMGHMSSEIFLKNYKNSRVDKKLAEEYFSITP
jgi:hypothetical protein